jgi:Iron-containing redox enzyme
MIQSTTSIGLSSHEENDHEENDSVSTEAITMPGRQAEPEHTAPDMPDPALIRAYADLPIFQPGPDVLLLGNPYLRPVSAQALAEVDWTRPVGSADALGWPALAAHRLLVNVYETESVILPKDGLSTAGDFDTFYGPEQRRLRDLVRPGLERYAYGFLDSAVEVSGHWTLDALVAHFTECVNEAGAAENVVMRTIEAARNPRDAAATYLIQLALDGLTEASAMARNLPGAYGPEQTELFKIFIDEFGYGVYQSKHSTIFEKLMRSCGLHTDIHAYWHFYLTGSLALINYFNYLTEDHTKFFRYCAAVTYMEWIFAQGFAEAGATLAKVYGPDADTHYTDEHAHIDQHHGKMTFENLLQGLAKRHGERVIPELVRGIEEIRLLLRLADEEFIEQLRWIDTLDEYRAAGARMAAGLDPRSGHLAELTAASPFTTRTYDEDRVLLVTDGAVDLHACGEGEPHRIEGGGALLVPAGRLHGVRPATEHAAVRVLRPERPVR